MDPRPPTDVHNNLTYDSLSSNDSYLMHHQLRAGLLGNDRRRSDYMREFFQREIEKERIREEIIAMELARKQVIEADIRRELLLEREFAMQRPGRYPSPSSMMMNYQHGGYDGRIDERMPPFGPVETRASSRLAFQHPPQVGVPEVNLPFQRHPDFAVSEVKQSFHRPPEPTVPNVNPIPQATTRKLLVLSKPLGTKRGASEAGPSTETKASKKKKGAKSKPHEWTCKLCQVTATSEQGLKDHLKGKKHQAKELRMRKTKGKIFQGKKFMRNGKRRPGCVQSFS